MSDFIEYVTEIIFVRDSLRVARDARTTERVRVKDRGHQTVGATLKDSVRVDDRIAGSVTGRTVERVRVKDLVSAQYLRESRTVEGVRVADRLRGVLGVQLREGVRASDEIRAGIGVRIHEVVRLTDSIQRVGGGARVKERVTIKDRPTGAVTAKVAERVLALDVIAGQVVGRITEKVHVADTLGGARMARLVERARVSDSIKGQLQGARTVEKLRVRDHATGAVTARIVDSVRVTDAIAGRASVIARSLDVIRVADSLVGERAVVGRITERMRVSDQLAGLYSASAQIHEAVFVTDQLQPPRGQGAAWTAPVGGWAMSRYDGFPIDSLVTVDGMAYGCGPGGVYALSGGDEVIDAKLTTGRLDVGKGALAHPTYAYLEYELDGQAVMGVKQTQSGEVAEAWDYPLDAEPAEHLTNGRFVFGRGLRGRNFAFDLKLKGKRAHIDDLYVVADAIKRRV